MFRHRLYWGSLLLVATMTGCKPATPPPSTQVALRSNDKPAGSNSTTKPSSAQSIWNLPDTDKPVITDPKGVDADALAQATRDYAKAMEQAMARHGSPRLGNNPTTNSAATGGDPSRVHFDRTARGAEAQASTAGANIPGGQTLSPAPDQVASLNPQVSNPGPTITQTPPRSDMAFNKDSPAVNTPLIVGQPRPLPATDAMAQRLAQQVKDYPKDVAVQLDWQLLQLLQGQSVPQLQSLSSLDSEDREMLSAVLDGLTNFRNALKADNNMLLSRKIRPMVELSDRLRTQAELSIPTIALCTDVKGFGVYEPLEPARFPADMKEHRVIVYCEVENFASQLDEQKRWQTKLTQDVVLYTEQNGLEVWRDKTPAQPIVDYSRNRRHDFFIVKMVRLPANLTIGRYLLKVSVTDQEVNRVAENSVAVQIVAQ